MRIWLALILAPLLAFTDQSIAFALVGWSCAHQSMAWVHAAHALFIVAALCCAWGAWRAARSTRAQVAPSPAALTSAQRRFLARVGAATALLSAIAIATMWIPAWMIAACIA